MKNVAVGSEYERLLGEFLHKGGDLARCPFDAGDYRYEGPELKNGEVVG